MSSYSSIFSNLDSTNSSYSSTFSTIPSVGFTMVVKTFRVSSSSLSKSFAGSVSLNVVASALLFPMVLKYVGHSCFVWPKPWHPKHFGPEGIVYWPPSLASFFPLSWLLNCEEFDYFRSLSNPKSFRVGILHKLLELPRDIGFSFKIFTSEDSSVSLLLAFNSMLLLLPDFPILVKPNS